MGERERERERDRTTSAGLQLFLPGRVSGTEGRGASTGSTRGTPGDESKN